MASLCEKAAPPAGKVKVYSLNSGRSAVGSAPSLGLGGRRFKSDRPDSRSTHEWPLAEWSRGNRLVRCQAVAV
jgi:hypothetical protein